MKKAKDTSHLEEYLEAHADELVDYSDENVEVIRDATEDDKARKKRAVSLQRLRKDKLKLSQSELAKAVGANVRTLQSWEQGRQDFPKSVEILMSLMNKIPGVKKELLPTSVRNRSRSAPGLKHKAPSIVRSRKAQATRKLAS